MITFIVTTYNLEDRLLRRCLSSIVAQGLAREHYEILVVDDESAISPQHVVNEFATQANIALHIQKHARQGAARNLALQYARGEWIQFVDGDDYLLEGAVPLVLENARTLRLDLLMFGVREVNDKVPMVHFPGIVEVAEGSVTTGDTYMKLHNLYGACWAFVFRKELLDDPQFGEPLRFTEGIYIEDEEFVTKLVWRAQRMAKTDVPVYAYYQRMDSTVHRRSAEHTDELFRNYFIVLKRLMDFEKSIGAIPHEGVVRKLRFLAVDILRRTLREPDWKKRWEHSTLQLRALGLYPIPDAKYSCKYRAFRWLSTNGVGRKIMQILETKQNKS
ncbi:MAG: glycosyltransferase family 2 protein [Bacteroidaceae bacterium]|nr:glycosyltransferase family 2 protein [Bacteroidaceae bacterium]